jgi:effector-binding domain-containing protein
MSGVEDVVLKDVGPIRVAELTGTAASYSQPGIEPVLRSLYPDLLCRLAAVGLQQADGPAIAYYEDPAEPSDMVIVHAAIPAAADPHPDYDFAVVDLPGIRSAAITHRGPRGELFESLLTLASWIEDNGYRSVGYHREVYLECYPNEAWTGMIELQAPVVKSLSRDWPDPTGSSRPAPSTECWVHRAQPTVRRGRERPAWIAAGR